MEPFLTLIIAVGGIATGIGAIWTAVVARRQLNEQRQFLKEQNEIAKSQAQLTEQSLAQTESSLSEQVQTLREQNERDRINLEVYLKYRMEERFDSEYFQNYRLRSLTHVKDNYFEDGDILEVQDLDPATEQVHDFFEDVGYLCRVGVLPVERVWSEYPAITKDWVLWEPAVKKEREELPDPHRYEHFEYLYHQIVALERQRGGTGERPTKEELREFVEDNLEYLEIEKPATGEEKLGKG